MQRIRFTVVPICLKTTCVLLRVPEYSVLKKKKKKTHTQQQKQTKKKLFL